MSDLTLQTKPVLVTGGTGHFGRDIVRRLVEDGHLVRVFARSPGPETEVEWAIGDLGTGEGMAAALQDVHTVINAATDSPIAQRGGFRPVDFFKSPSQADVDGTRRMLALCEAAGVEHFLHVSIVGLDDGSLPYARVKLAGERLVRESSLSWSVVRAMPFYYLLDRLLGGLTWLPVWPVPNAVFNPVDTSDVAAYLMECAFDGNRGMRSEIGGPEDLSCTTVARQYQEHRGMHRPIFAVRVSENTARGMSFAVAKGRRGALRWSEWLTLPEARMPRRGR
jgi:uncharacterized protein YbjT (DUF2867 family)